MAFAGSMLRCILFLFNLVFVLCGILLVAWGALTLKNVKDIKNFEGVLHTSSVPILAIVLGSVIFIVAFCGCCGAITESVGCIYTYSVFMLIITILQIALVVWMFDNRETFVKDMDAVIKTAYDKNDDYNGYPMDPIQLIFECCGLNSYKDYNGDVPNTCCGNLRDSDEICTKEVYAQRNGCRTEFKEFWKTHTNIVRWVGIFVAAIEFVVLWLSCALASKIRTYD